MSKHFLTLAAVCAVVLFLGADASVQGAGRGGSGGGHGGGGGYGGHGYGGYGYGGRGYGYGGGFYGGGFYGGGFYGGGLFYGDYITGGGYPGYFAPYVYPTYPTPGYSYSNPVAPSSAPRISSYYPPIDLNAASPATIHVVLPDPQATVLFDGRATSSTGGERYYSTPDLTPGGSYHYQLRATWMQDGKQMVQERTVSVTPGKTTDVVFAPTAGAVSSAK